MGLTSSVISWKGRVTITVAEQYGTPCAFARRDLARAVLLVEVLTVCTHDGGTAAGYVVVSI